jgi:hypothetical protein
MSRVPEPLESKRSWDGSSSRPRPRRGWPLGRRLRVAARPSTGCRQPAAATFAGRSWYLWRGVIPRLAPRARVICPDLRDFGWTDVPSSGYDRERGWPQTCWPCSTRSSSTASAWSIRLGRLDRVPPLPGDRDGGAVIRRATAHGVRPAPLRPAERAAPAAAGDPLGGEEKNTGLSTFLLQDSEVDFAYEHPE